jgi:hypothetical protein
VYVHTCESRPWPQLKNRSAKETCPEAEFMNIQLREVSGYNLESFQT